MQRYSLYGSPAFEEQFSMLLQDIVASFKDRIALSSVKALVLGGGYGRGEGGVMTIDDQERPYNDLDFFVFTGSLNLFRKRRLVSSLQSLHGDLSAQHKIDIDFSLPISISGLYERSISLMFYDLAQAHKVVYGNPHILSALPRWQARDIPIPEAIRLLLNRGVGLLFAREYYCSESPDAHVDFINRNIHKAFQAIAEAILIAEGCYDSSINTRMRKIEQIDLGAYRLDKSILEELLNSMRFKLKPTIPVFDAEELRFRLDKAIDTIMHTYYSLWTKELATYIDNAESLYAAMPGSARDIRLKNILLNYRDKGLRQPSSALLWLHPRYSLYLCLPHFLLCEEVQGFNVATVLGIAPNSTELRMRNRFIKLWKRYN
ncbi:MAG TPA: hypothetical protein DHW79_08650 [Candidatus Cloacimonas sp.]|jgi:hypothetical protein|nr:hypothetical protein [Candidatus Cloacimonas sp.]